MSCLKIRMISLREKEGGETISDCGFRIADFGLRISDCGFRIADFGLRISDCGMMENVESYVFISRMLIALRAFPVLSGFQIHHYGNR